MSAKSSDRDVGTLRLSHSDDPGGPGARALRLNLGCPVLRILKGGDFDVALPTRSAHGIDADQTLLPTRIERKTAPRPIPRMRDQISLHRVHVHVVEFLDKLGLTPDVEIVETGLPELRPGVVGVSERKPELLGGHSPARLAAESARDALLQDLHHDRKSALDRLADEQMNVIGQDDVAGECKSVAIAHFA